MRLGAILGATAIRHLAKLLNFKMNSSLHESSSGTNSLNSLSKSSNGRSTQRVFYVLLLRLGSSVEPPTPQKSGKNGVRSCYGFTPEKLPKGMCIRGGQFYYRRNVPKDAQGLAWHGLPKMPFWSA